MRCWKCTVRRAERRRGRPHGHKPFDVRMDEVLALLNQTGPGTKWDHLFDWQYSYAEDEGTEKLVWCRISLTKTSKETGEVFPSQIVHEVERTTGDVYDGDTNLLAKNRAKVLFNIYD